MTAVRNTTINLRGHDRRHKQSTYPVWRLGKYEEKDVSSFSSSSFDTATTKSATDAELADDVEAPVKDCSKEEAADGTAGADGLFDTHAAAANEGDKRGGANGSVGKAAAWFRSSDH